MVPDEVNGLPLHVLSVHATVVLVPLAAVLGLLFAVPRLRAWARIPLPLVAVGAALSTFVSTQSGENFESALQLSGPAAELIEEHEELGEQLLWLVIGYALLAVVAAVVVAPARRGHSDDEYDKPSRGSSSPALAAVFSVLLVVGAVLVGVQTYRVGELGSEAVWNPDGTADFSSD